MTLQRRTPLRARRPGTEGAKVTITHGKLVRLVGRWLRGPRRMPVVLHELAHEAEQPDVIAWDTRGRCTVVECKVSRADYLADKHKHFRRDPGMGMGGQRFYAAPAGLLDPAELPEGWGLLEVSPRGVRQAKAPGYFTAANDRAEKSLLVSAVQRATEGWGRGVFGEGAPVDEDGDPHPIAARLIKGLRQDAERLRGRVAELEAMTSCRTCGGPVELARRCYAIPTCYACLPPPEPLEVITP